MIVITLFRGLFFIFHKFKIQKKRKGVDLAYIKKSS